LIYQLKEQTAKGYLKKMYDYSLGKVRTSLGFADSMHVRSRSSLARSSGYGKDSLSLDIK